MLPWWSCWHPAKVLTQDIGLLGCDLTHLKLLFSLSMRPFAVTALFLQLLLKGMESRLRGPEQSFPYNTPT